MEKGENTSMMSSGGESINRGPIPKRKRSSKGVVPSGGSRSGIIPRGKRPVWSSGGDSSASGHIPTTKAVVNSSNSGGPIPTTKADTLSGKILNCRLSSLSIEASNSMYPKSPSVVVRQSKAEILAYLDLKYAAEASAALDYYNQHSSQKFKLLNITAVVPVPRPRCPILHINFTAINTDVAHAPEEMFFAEFTIIGAPSVRFCVSLGPINSLSGDKLNGCYYCSQYNTVWHPKGGGFVRGGDWFYKSVQEICDINQNNAIANHNKHLSMRSDEPKREREYISEQVDDESLYATEALKTYNQKSHFKYELVKPGSVIRVILPTCSLFHVNFMAKETDVATAPEKMFFAEMTSTSGVISCKSCTILDPSGLISGDTTGDKTNGCYYCHEFNNVHHPNKGFVRGGDSLYVLEKDLPVRAPLLIRDDSYELLTM